MFERLACTIYRHCLLDRIVEVEWIGWFDFVDITVSEPTIQVVVVLRIVLQGWDECKDVFLEVYERSYIRSDFGILLNNIFLYCD